MQTQRSRSSKKTEAEETITQKTDVQVQLEKRAQELLSQQQPAAAATSDEANTMTSISSL